MGTAAQQLKCGGMKGKSKKMADGGTVEDSKKSKLPKGFTPSKDGNPLHNALYYAQNLDNPEAYRNRDIFSSAGQVAGIYNDIREHSGKDWLKTQGRFMENVNKYSDYFHNMRQAPLDSEDTDLDNPGIVGYKEWHGMPVIRKDSPDAKDFLQQTNYGLPMDLMDREGVNFAKRWHRYHGLGGSDDNPKAGKVEQVYDIRWGKDRDQAARLPKDVWESKMAEFKAAGKKTSYQYGGEVNPGSYDKMPGSSAEASRILGLGTNSATEGISLGGGSLTSGLSSGVDMLTGLGTGAIDESKKKIALDYDPRENPLADIEKSNKLDTGKALLKGAAKGAAAGAAFGPIGLAVGAAAGTLISGIGRLIGKKNREEEASEAVKGWSAGWTNKAADYAASSSYKDGGEIKGKGGPRSDSIKMQAEDGSFIVPAENNELGMNLGKTYLGWNDDTHANRNNGGSGIKVSDGEVLYTPEEVGILKYHGINLDELAPNAETQNRPTMKSSQNFATGGWKFDKEKGLVIDESNGIAYDKDGNEYTKDTSGQLSLSSNNTATGKSIWSKYGEGGVPEIDKPIDEADPDKEAGEFNRKWYDYVPELAGTIQSIGGAAGLISAGKAPDRTVSATLNKLSAETRRLASFGYEPKVLNALDTQIEKARRDVSKSITGRGGSPQEVMAQLQQVLSTTIDKKAGVIMGNAAEKARKWSEVIKVDTMKAGQEFDINKLNVEDWYKNQDVFAEMLSAGISNIVGARQLKNEQDVIREIGTANPTFSKTS